MIEPYKDDELLFSTNLFSYSNRDKLCEYAYQQTRRQIREQIKEVQPILERHSYTINETNLYSRKRQMKDFLNQEKMANSRVMLRLDETLNKLSRAISH